MIFFVLDNRRMISKSRWNNNLMSQYPDFMLRLCLYRVFFISYFQLPPPSEYFTQLSVKKCWKLSLLTCKTSYSLSFEVSLFTLTTEIFWHYSVCHMGLLLICLLSPLSFKVPKYLSVFPTCAKLTSVFLIAQSNASRNTRLSKTLLLGSKSTFPKGIASQRRKTDAVLKRFGYF